jgi:hypothetical protein
MNPLSPVSLVTGVSDEPADYLHTLQDALVGAELALEKAQSNMSKYYNKKHTDHVFQVGDLVYVNYSALPPKRRGSKISPLFHPHPFKIIAQIGAVSFKLQTPATWKLHNVFHVSQLRKQRPLRHLVPRCVNDLCTRYGQPMALVSFEGCTRHDDQWLPVSSIPKPLVDAYRAMDEAMVQELYGDL